MAAPMVEWMRHRAKTLEGLLARLAAKVAAYTCGQVLNDRLGDQCGIWLVC
jgi:hypothetical protein